MNQEQQREERLSLAEKRDMLYEVFRTNLRLLRNNAGVSGSDLAGQLYNSPKSRSKNNGKRILDLEYGRTNPTMDEALLIAKYFGVALSDLMQREIKLSFVDEIKGVAYIIQAAKVYRKDEV